LREVDVPEPQARLRQYPHELSGGMRQRVALAMALMCDPPLLLADEPTTALDASVQARVLASLARLRDRGLGLVLVTHDLGVVAGLADRVAVMYAGRIVEAAPTQALFEAPAHPYTAALLAAVPTLTGDLRARLPAIEGQPPRPGDIDAGCAFAPRCERAVALCTAQTPSIDSDPTGRREFACHRPRLHVEHIAWGSR
jgi:peptide/nickel transport system ATP-binding protein